MLKHQESEHPVSLPSPGVPGQVSNTESSPLASPVATGSGEATQFEQSSVGRRGARSGGLFRDNPVFTREVTMRLSVRRMSTVNRIAGAVVVGLVLPAYHLFFLYLSYESMNAGDVRNVAVVIEALVLSVLTSSLMSSACSGEREKQTWNALLLSRLSPAQIVAGKLAGGVAPALLALAALWPMNLLLGVRAGIPWQFQLAELACLLGTIALTASTGLFWSWANRRTQAAQVFTAGSVLLLLMGSFVAHSLWASIEQSYGPMMRFPLHWFNPLAVVVAAAQRGAQDQAMAQDFVPFFLSFCAVASAVLAAIPIRRLAQGPDEMVH